MREKQVVKQRHFLQEELNEPQITSDPDTGVPALSVLFTSHFAPLWGSAFSMRTITILQVNTAASSAPLPCLSTRYPWEKREESSPNDRVSKQIYFKEKLR